MSDRCPGAPAPPSVQPWILNATVKANITFMEPWDERRYAAVLHACALTHDLEVGR